MSRSSSFSVGTVAGAGSLALFEVGMAVSLAALIVQGVSDAALPRLIGVFLVSAAVGIVLIGFRSSVPGIVSSVQDTTAVVVAGVMAALVADVPGTTRDHVGLTLTLDGLVVRYLDTPGLHPGEDPDPLTGRATQTAARLVAGADLVLDCRDASEPEGGVTLPEGVASLTVLLRSDRVGSLQPGADAVPTSAATLEGVAELAAAVRNALVPDAALSDTRPWRFWQPA